MRTVMLGIVFAVIALPAAASDQTDVEALVRSYNKTFSAASCAAQSSVIDDFGQHYWPAPSGCADWAKSFDAFAKAEGVTDIAVTAGKPVNIAVDGDHAYAVYSAHFDYKLKGKPVHEKATWTFALAKLAGTWKIAAWSWGAL